MEDIHARMMAIKKEFRLMMNGAVSKSMRDSGLDYKVNFGVELLRLREIASHYDKSHDLAQALWKEDIRESKIVASLLQPVDTFYPEIADIWVEDIRNMEIAEQTTMNLFQHLPYAPAKAFQWISLEQEFTKVCGYLVIGRLLLQKGDMDERAENLFLDQGITDFLSCSYNVRASVMKALRRFIQHSEDNAFSVCRRVEQFKDSASEMERLLYEHVRNEVDV